MISISTLYKVSSDKLCLEWLRTCHPILEKFPDKSELLNEIRQITLVLLSCLDPLFPTSDSNIEIAVECSKLLARSCPIGPEVQNAIVENSEFFPIIKNKIEGFDSFSPGNSRFLWLLLANVCVQNQRVQELLWTQESNFLLSVLSLKRTHWDICTMILYNMHLSSTLDLDPLLLMDTLLEWVVPANIAETEWLQLFLDRLLQSNRDVMIIFGKIERKKRRLLLYYIGESLTLSDSSKQQISTFLLQFLVKEFKKTSDCVLKTESSYVNKRIALEVHDLLNIISMASGIDTYLPAMASDGSLFLNCGCLLRAIIDVGSQPDNAFSPIQKLSVVAPSSTEDSSFEQDYSYGFKTMLVRTLANLSHKNPQNQQMAREMKIMEAILNCTGVDARNPLLREWSIIAIRNLCELNPENQQLVQSLTKIGDADNSAILKEFDINMGSLRISGDN